MHHELHPLGQVGAGQAPVAQVGRARAGEPEAVQRRAEVDHQGEDPERQPRVALDAGAGEPDHAGQRRPRQELGVVAAHHLPPQGDDHERAADHLDGDVGRGEGQGLIPEGLRDRGRHDQADQHQHHQQHPHREPVRVDPVGGPGRVVPGPPDREEQDEGLDRAARAQVLEQGVRELRDREDVDQVEEQLHAGDARGVTGTVAQQDDGHGGPQPSLSVPLHRAPDVRPEQREVGRAEAVGGGRRLVPVRVEQRRRADLVEAGALLGASARGRRRRGCRRAAPRCARR